MWMIVPMIKYRFAKDCTHRIVSVWGCGVVVCTPEANHLIFSLAMNARLAHTYQPNDSLT